MIKIIGISLLTLLLQACGSDSHTPPKPEQTRYVDLNVSIATPSPAIQQSIQQSITYNHKAAKSVSSTEITQITLIVQNGATTLKTVAMHFDATTNLWSANIPSLPVGPELTLQATALNNQNEEIFFASQNIILTPEAEDNRITLMMESTTENESGTVPSGIIRVPTEVIVGTQDTIEVEITGESNAVIDYRFTAEQGAITPLTGTITLNPLGKQTLTVNYTAPSAPGTYTYSLDLKQQNSIVTQKTHFTITSVLNEADGTIKVFFAPVVTAVQMQRKDDDIEFALFVDDDQPIADITYAWSFDGDLDFADNTTNPAILQDYTTDISGEVTIKLTDSDNLTTIFTIQINPSQFPETEPSSPNLTAKYNTAIFDTSTFE